MYVSRTDDTLVEEAPSFFFFLDLKQDKRYS